MSKSTPHSLTVWHVIDCVSLPLFRFVLGLRTCLMQLFYYKKVAEEALQLADVPFDKSNPDHSNLLVVSGACSKDLLFM